jgi:hypothetical protein
MEALRRGVREVVLVDKQRVVIAGRQEWMATELDEERGCK